MSSLVTVQPVASGSPRAGLFYGWIMLPLAMLALAATSPGQTYGIMIFNESIRAELSLTHGQFALAYTLGTLFGAVPITLFGWMMDRHGIRRVMLATIVLFSLACLVAAQARSWSMLVLGFSLLRMLGPGALAFASGNTLAYWFDRRLGLVEGIRSLGTAISMALTPVLCLWLMKEYGWRGAYAFFGIGIAISLLPVFWWLFRSLPSDVGQEIDGTPRLLTSEAAARSRINPLDFTMPEALRTLAFWTISGSTALYGLIQTALFFSLVPIFEERGLGANDAAVMLTTFGIVLIFTQVWGGYLADHYRAQPLIAAGLLTFAAGVACLNYASSSFSAVLCGSLFGCGQGIFLGATQPVWVRFFGRSHLGKIRGFLMTLNIASSSLGPLFPGLTRDAFGHFHVAMFVFMLAPVPLAVLAFKMKKPFKVIKPVLELPAAKEALSELPARTHERPSQPLVARVSA